MAVIAKWICDRDDSMFSTKKEAEAHDKLLELAEQFSALLLKQIPEVDEYKAEAFGIFLANNKDAVMDACKGKTDALLEISKPMENTTTEAMADEVENTVTPLVAEAS